MRKLGLAVMLLILVGCSTTTVQPKDVPPTGAIWFGTSFDPQTFALTGQRTTVGTQEPVALVAHLSRALDSGLTIRASLDGTFVNSAPITVQGSGDVFGFVLGALQAPGEWRYDVVDIGGNVLATGAVTAS